MDQHIYDGWEEAHDERSDQEDSGLMGRLTARGSAMLDSWFGMNEPEQRTIDGPSILEQQLINNDGAMTGLPMWDIDFGFGGDLPAPPTPARSLRHLAPQNNNNVLHEMDYEMDNLVLASAPPALPPREGTSDDYMAQRVRVSFSLRLVSCCYSAARCVRRIDIIAMCVH
jgi:hypothetical protein